MRARHLSGAVFLAFWLASCTHAPVPATERAFDENGATAMFSAGYSMIQDKYLEPVTADQLALDGLEGLHALDESISFERRGDMVHISLPRHPDVDLLAPPPTNISGWSHLTTLGIEVARSDSPTLAGTSNEDLYQAVFKGALSKLDRYSRYTSAAAARNARASREGYGGIGIRLRYEPGEVKVEAVMADTPAARADLRVGDRILRIDEQAVDKLEERDVIERLRGRVSSPVKLTLARDESPAPFEVAINRALIFNPTVEYEPQGDAAVIKLSSFNQSTSRNLTRAIDKARREMGPQMKGIVLDMRDNPGGLLDQAVAVSDLFLASGRIVSTRGRHPDSLQVYDATGRDVTNGMPLVVLVNGQSASAAEIVAAALQDRGRAVVVGSNSFGKGTVQNISRLPNNGEMVLTWSRFHAPSGYAIASLGILPNVCTSLPGATADSALDPLNPQWAKTSILLSSWRISQVRDEKQLDTLRDNCPRSKDSQPLDLTVAERLIDEPALYRRALQQNNSMVAEPAITEPAILGSTAARLPSFQ
ncbi:MAG TPA: S41 family peptidase [Alphaproteobacteria bacterium]|jgi:carboxyl-terminal processing protease